MTEGLAHTGRQYTSVNEGGHDKRLHHGGLGTKDLATQCTF